MFKNIETKQYRFKMNNVTITVDLDSSFHKLSFADEPNMISYIKYQHYHIAHELFFVEESPITLLADGKAYEYKNCILSIPPKFNHLSFRQKDYRILFSFSYDEEKSNSFANFLKTIGDSSSPQKLEIDSDIISYIRELSNIVTSKSSMSEEVALSILKLIFYKIYVLNTHKQNDSAPSTSESYILKIDKIINSFQNDINLQTVADSLHLSTKQTSRIIAKAYKKSLSELLKEKRLNVACLLLRHTDKTISEIVEYVNFPSESYFYFQFKKTFGCTPYKYKKIKDTELQS